MLRPFLLALTLCVSAAALAPLSLAAQPGCLECEGGGGPGNPEPAQPNAYIQQTQSSYSGLYAGMQVPVVVLWCTERGEHDPATALVLVNGDTAGLALDSSWGACPLGMSGFTSRLQAQLRPGANTVVARICSVVNPSICGWDQVSIGYTWVTRGLAVTPDEGIAVAAAGSAAQQAFTVTNAGTGPVDVTFRVSTCSGGVSGCGVPAALAALQPGESRTVAVPFVTGAPGTRGDLRLRARVASDTTIYDEGAVQVSVPTATGSALPPRVVLTDAKVEIAPTPSLCVTLPAGPGASWGCGDLRLAHGAPAFSTLGRVRQPVLVYNSAHAQPEALVQVQIRLRDGSRSPDEVRVHLAVTGATPVTRVFAGGEWTDAVAYRTVSIGVPANLATGFHRYSVQVTNVYGADLQTAPTVRGVVGVVNRSGSAFGTGWWLAGLEALEQITTDSVTWVGSDGAMRRYRRVGTAGAAATFTATSVTHPDTLLRDPDGSYRRLLPNRVHVGFDALGRHTGTVTPVDTTVFHYTPAGELAHIEVPAPSGVVWSHAFLYEAVPGDPVPRLVQILRVRDRFGVFSQDVANALRVGHALGGRRITHLTDPDGHSVSLAYEDAQAPGRVTRRTDRMQVPTTYTYGAGGLLVETSTPVSGAAPVRHRYEPGKTRGWTQSTLRTETHYHAPGTESRAVRFRTNGRGAPVRIWDPLDRYVDVTYDSTFPALARRVRQVDGRVSGAVYDARGRLTSSTDSSSSREVNGVLRHATTHYEYGDAHWPHRPTRIVAPEGEETHIGYDSVHGGRRWITDARGLTAATEFFYSANGRLLESVLSPENRADDLRQRFAYDPLGNLERSTSPLGNATYFYKDALGRDTLVQSPVNHPTAGPRPEQRIAYDAMDRVRTTRTYGPAIPYTRRTSYHQTLGEVAPAQELVVRNAYDAEGRLLLVSRRAIPDSAGIDSVVTRWERDELGRVLREVAPDGRRDLTLYDGAGRVAGYLSRRGLLTTMRYDVMGRLVERITPPVSYPGSVQYFQDPQEPAWHFPLFAQEPQGHFGEAPNPGGGGVVVPGDTARFTYDAAGRLRTANNRDARIARRYDGAGRLVGDTLRIRAYAGTAFPHVYGLRYEYDLNGRRTRLHHPQNLYPGAAAAPHSTDWRYNALGEVERVEHSSTLAGATFTYDLEGRPRVVQSPARQESWYDADGRVSLRLDGIVGPSQLRYETYSYDARGKIVETQDLRHDESVLRHSWNAYDGLGMLVWSGTRDDSGRGSWMEEGLLQDALGNARGIRRHSVTGQALAGEDLSQGDNHVFASLTGRLQSTHSTGSQASHPFALSFYDAAGNQYFRAQNRGVLTPYAFPVGPQSGILGGATEANAALIDRTFSYFGADERLRVLDRRTCLMVEDRCQSATPAQDERSSFEEHRYDALGRRVLLHARQAAFCNGAICRSHVVRTVWDGDQVLHEVSAPASGVGMERDVQEFLEDYRDVKRFGRVMYVHAGAIDYPIAVIRSEYSDSLPNAAILYPLSNHRGQYDMGVGIGTCAFIQGRTYRLAEPIGEPRVGSDTAIDMRDFTDPMEDCIQVDWPGRKSFSTGYRRPTWGRAAPWVGSLIYHGRDPSGQMYRRNRFYDPQSGRFTQEDPIGIAGGLNVYGYANGDPITYSDPYGLSPSICPPCRLALVGARGGAVVGGAAGTVVPVLGNGIGAVGGAVLGGIGGLSVGVWLMNKADEANQSAEPVEPSGGTIFVDSDGNAIPTTPGGTITGSPDGRFIQGRDAEGHPSGVRKDGGHRPSTHPDPRAQQPHGHRPTVRNPDGTPWLPINTRPTNGPNPGS